MIGTLSKKVFKYFKIFPRLQIFPIIYPTPGDRDPITQVSKYFQIFVEIFPIISPTPRDRDLSYRFTNISHIFINFGHILVIATSSPKFYSLSRFIQDLLLSQSLIRSQYIERFYFNYKAITIKFNLTCTLIKFLPVVSS